MEWPATLIGAVCVPTEQRDPRRQPNRQFRYVDIAGIDRDQKRITEFQELVGSEAPSRARKVIREGDVIVSTVRPNLNAVAPVPKHLDGEIASTGFCVLRANRGLVEPPYLFYRAISSDFIATLTAKVRGANYPAVSDADVKDVAIPLPPLSEQRRIVEILDQADRLHRLRAEADAKADRILPALFIKMFGDPATNPMGWPVVSFDRVFTDITSRCPKIQRKDYRSAGRFPVIDQGKEFIAGFTDDEALCHRPNRAVVVFGDHTRVLKLIEFPFVAGADGSRIFEVNEGFEPAFAAQLLSLHPIPDLGYSRHMRVVRRMAFMSPPRDMQVQFGKAHSSYRRHVPSRCSAMRRIESVWDSLLHRAFTGSLTASWREAHMKELLQEMEQQARTLATG